MSCGRYEYLIDHVQPNVSASQFSILTALARALPSAGSHTRMSLIDLIARTGLSRGTIITALQVLERRGFLQIDRRNQETNGYSMPILDHTFATPVAAEVVQNLYPSEIRSDQSISNTSKKNTDLIRSVPDGPKFVPPTRTPSSPPQLPAAAPAVNHDDPFVQAQINAINLALDRFESITEDRPADFAGKLLQLGQAWINHGYATQSTGIGFDIGRRLTKAFEWIDRHPEQKPMKWNWCTKVVRTHFQEEVEMSRRADKERARQTAIERERSTPARIDEQSFRFRDPKAEHCPDFTAAIHDRIRKAVGR
jgi:hypothetical protein